MAFSCKAFVQYDQLSICSYGIPTLALVYQMPAKMPIVGLGVSGMQDQSNNNVRLCADSHACTSTCSWPIGAEHNTMMMMMRCLPPNVYVTIYLSMKLRERTYSATHMGKAIPKICASLIILAKSRPFFRVFVSSIAARSQIGYIPVDLPP